MYVDDVLDSFETIEEACSLRRDLSEVLSDAGFKLRKWLSNETSVIADVPIEDRVSGVEISEGKDLQTQKTLGVTWNAETDTFTFQVQPPTNSWAAGLDWDDVLPAELDSKWKTWISEFQELPNVTIPRCLRNALPTSIQLHTFSDASKAAYAAVAMAFRCGQKYELKYPIRSRIFWDRSREYDIRSPKYDNRSPKYDNRSPKYDDRSPKYDNRSREYDIRSREYDIRVENTIFEVDFF
jgi:hypothetical protein